MANFGEALVTLTRSAVKAANAAEAHKSQIDSWAVARVGALLASRWRDPDAPEPEALENQFLPHPIPIKKSAAIVSAQTAGVYRRLLEAGQISEFAVSILAPISRRLLSAAPAKPGD